MVNDMPKIRRIQAVSTGSAGRCSCISAQMHTFYLRNLLALNEIMPSCNYTSLYHTIYTSEVCSPLLPGKHQALLQIQASLC